MTPHLYQLLQERARRYPNAIAFGGQQGIGWRTLTGAELLRNVDLLAAELATKGVGAGDRVVLWLPNQPRTPVYLFALWRLGAVPVPFDRELNPAAAERIVASVQARCVITGYEERPAWAGNTVVYEWWEPGSQGGFAATDAWPGAEEDMAAIFFTSGTTGSPKGCMITHANLCSQVESLRHTITLNTDSRLASILPLSHLFELTVGMLYPLFCGAAVHYVPSRRGPDIVRVLKEQCITHLVGVPQLLDSMGAALDEQLRKSLPARVRAALFATAERLPMAARHRLFFFVHRRIGGQLRLMASGGAALNPDTQRLWERLGVRVVQGYGASECSPVISCGDGDGNAPVGSVGKPLSGVEVRLSATNEILVRGPNVMRGYWCDPERTAEVLSDGWYSTGDLGRIDAGGNIFIEGRAKDLIVLPSGMNVWPQDVEDALRSHVEVRDACVIAVPRASGGVTLHAYLLPRAPAARQTPPEDVIRGCNAELAAQQRVATASWWRQDDFPRTPTLKVKRKEIPLPDDLTAAEPAAVPLAGDVVASAVMAVAKVPAMDDAQTLGELGLDSLTLVDLAITLEEKCGRAVPEDALGVEMTVADVRTFLASTAGADAAADADRSESLAAEAPLWPYGWGRLLRPLGLPFDLLYRGAVSHTVVLGREHLQDLPRNVIFSGTHHGFADVPLLRSTLGRSPARGLKNRLVVAVGAGSLENAGPFKLYAMLAFGLFPLRQRAEQQQSLRRLVTLAQQGNPVLIFPQGTHVDPVRERAGDPAVRFRPGVGHLAEALQVPVVPFGQAGTEKLLPADADAFHGPKIAGVPVAIQRGPLAIAFGAPLHIEPGESPQQFTEQLQEVCYALAQRAAVAADLAESGVTYRG